LSSLEFSLHRVNALPRLDVLGKIADALSSERNRTFDPAELSGWPPKFRALM